jgi:hypothetical protein
MIEPITEIASEVMQPMRLLKRNTTLPQVEIGAGGWANPRRRQFSG